MVGVASPKLITACLATTMLLGSVRAATQVPPYALEKRRDALLTAVGFAMVVGAIPVRNAQEPLTADEIAALDPNDVNAFDRPATEQWSMGARDASDVLVLTLLASPVALAISDVAREQASTIGLMYMETFLVSNGLTQLLKGLTSRTRPYAYNDDPGIPEEDKQHIHAVRSFPSGHTSNAFAAAVFLSSTYSKLHPHSPARTWVWLGSLTAASTVGYLRYRAGQHYPTDVIAGAILGASMGFLVPKLHEVGPVYVAPTDGGLAIGTVLSF